jgi:hypothetical protein
VIESPPGAEIEPLVAEIRSFFGGHPGGPCLLKSLFPLPDLTPHGWTLMGHPPLMLRTPIARPARLADLQIVEVNDEHTSCDYEEALVFGYPAPMLKPFRAGCFLPSPALDAVAAGSCYVDDRVLRVENIAVMADTRGRGFGAAITAATIAVNLDTAATLVASDLGRPVYENSVFARSTARRSGSCRVDRFRANATRCRDRRPAGSRPLRQNLRGSPRPHPSDPT